MHIYVNTLKKSKITQKYPMYLKLVYNGEKIETRLPKTMDVMESELKFWDKSSTLFTHKKDDPRNIDLMDFQVRFNKYLRLNDHRLVDPINVIMAKVLNKPSIDKNWTVLSYCEYYFQNRVKDNIERGKGTKTNYQKAITHLTNFLVKNDLAKLPLDSFKHKHAQDFQIYMGSDAQNVASSTTTNIIRLNTIFKEAINEELITKNPFSQLKLHYKAVNRTPTLTISQLSDIIQSEGIKNDPKLPFFRDIFLFTCFTGLSTVDIHKLSYDALFKFYDNRFKLDTSRQKTGKIVIQVLPDCAKRIIDRHGLLRHANQGVVFPSFTDDDFREKLKLFWAKFSIYS
jgi:hypothetical protein